MNRAQRASHAVPFAQSPGEATEGLQGNRPAAGARQASPGQVLNTAFQGSATAGDFLGLDLEVNEASSPGGLELASVNPYGSQPAGATAEMPEESHVPRPLVPRQLPEERGFDEELLDEEQPAKRSAGPQAALAFVVGLAAVVGIVIGPRFLKKDEPKPAVRTQVASTPSPAPSDAASDPAGGSVPEGAATTTGGELGVEQPADELAGYEQPQDELTGEELGTDLLAAPSAGDQGATGGGQGEPNAFGDLFRRFTEGDPSASVSALPSDQGAPIEGTTFDASLFTADTWMTGELVDMVWRDTAVPMEAIAHPARIMTPRVGPVRVHLDSGEVFEGRLYAVGQNRVWLESDMGRLGIDGQHVVEFEHLLPQDVQKETFEPTSIGTGRRVRVQVPGGVLYGRVLSVVDTHVTLITDEGARVVLESPEIEPLGPSRAILVER